jgi:hypothetical protein
MRKTLGLLTIIWITAFSYRSVAIAIPLSLTEHIALMMSMLEAGLYKAKKEEQDGSNQ